MTITDFADFLRGENLIFLLIIGAIFVSFLWSVIIVFAKIFRALSRVFGGNKKRSEFTKNSDVKEGILPDKSESSVLPKPKIMGGDFVKITPPKKVESELEPEIEAKPGRYKFFQNSSDAKKQEKMAEGFNKNFSALTDEEPSKAGARVGVVPREEHEISVEKPKISENSPIKKVDEKSVGEIKPVQKSVDKSIFGGKQELSRKELKYKLYKDPKAYKAARESLLNMNAIQREKLVKDLFPTVYGSNISKSDIKTRTHKLSQKMLSEKNPQAKALLRKEIKFVKKIGGIK